MSTNMVDFKAVNKIHMIGVGGIGMSGLARLFLYEGKKVSGSDRAPSLITNTLEQEGVKFFGSQTAENITSMTDIELVVYTEAMAKDHSEMVLAKELGVPMLNYFEALALVANQYYLIAVAGTHGKTTTTAMLIDIFEEAGLDPTAIVGSLRAKTGSNYRAGKSKYFIVEACEYKRDFLYLEPDVLVITNIEAEHLDYYKDLDDVQTAFRELAIKVREGGVVVAQIADPNVATVLEGLNVEVIDYKPYLDLLLPLKVPGVHNRMNAAAARATAYKIGIADEVTKTALSNFVGTWRRFEYKGTLNGAPIYDDYGHHPTELTATMSGARELYPDKKLIVVFQPHLYSRTAELFENFVEALSQADRVIVTHVYDARDTGKQGVNGGTLAEAVAKINSKTTYIESFDDVVSELKSSVTKSDVVLIMGAGDVAKVAGELTK
ncbi:UDP-N-acetylmuramate--L-alanine ligase [Candidatus Nomurabacteria bacterium]|nr:UDP-N-acetylmuramate--L-alanine ligase [Candidatus Nomurabacteria bacterium]